MIQTVNAIYRNVYTIAPVQYRGSEGVSWQYREKTGDPCTFPDLEASLQERSTHNQRQRVSRHAAPPCRLSIQLVVPTGAPHALWTKSVALPHAPVVQWGTRWLY